MLHIEGSSSEITRYERLSNSAQSCDAKLEHCAIMSNLWAEAQAELTAMGISERSTFVGGTLLVIFVCFYLHGWFFVLADWYGFMDRWAIRSGNHKVATMDKQWDAIREASIDVFLVKPIVLYFVYPFVAGKVIHFDAELPSIGTAFAHWLCMKLVFSTSLYWLHRAMHHKSIYQYVHKRHHLYHDTVGFASQYAHPIEGLASALHVIFGILLVKPHFVVFLLFFATTMIEIIDSHCGYDVPWAWLYPWSDRYFWGSGARAHDFHHSHNVGVYGGGLVGLWDVLMGTDAAFAAHEKKRRSSSQATHSD